MHAILALLALTVVLSAGRAYGQLTQVKFSNEAVKLGSGESLAQAIQRSSDGGYVVASRRNGKVALVDPTTKGEISVDMGSTDGALLTKYGSDGKLAMYAAFKGNVSIQKIAATPDGGAIVGGVYKGPMLLVNASGEIPIAADASTDLTRLFVAEVKVDGTLGTVLLPKHDQSTPPMEDSPSLSELYYSDVSKTLLLTVTINDKIILPDGKSYEPPVLGFGLYDKKFLHLEISLQNNKVLASLEASINTERSKDLFGNSAVSSLVVSPDGADGKYVASSFFGQIDEVDNLTASEITTKHGEGKEKLDSTRRIILERRKADGAKMWSNTVVLANFHLDDNYHSDATVNYVMPLGDGKRFVVVGLFDGELMFDDGTKLTSKAEDNGYSTDAFVIVGDAQTGKILSKRVVGLSLAGYVRKVLSVAVYPLSAVLDGEDLVLALPLQGSITVGSMKYESKDEGKEDGKVRYNSLIAHVSLAPGDDLAMQAALSLTHKGNVRIDGLAKIKSGEYAYVGSVKSRDDAGTGENTKFYVNGKAVDESIADAKSATVSIAGKVKLGGIVKVEFIAHEDCVDVKLQKNEEAAIDYSNDASLPTLRKGDKLTVTAALKSGKEQDYALLPIEINGEKKGVYTHDGVTPEINVTVGAYKTTKPITVTVDPAGSAELKLTVSGTEKVFKGEKEDPKVTVKNGESVEGVLVTETPGYKLREILVQGKNLGEGVTSYALPEDDQSDALKIEVRMEATEFPILCKVVNASYGKVSVSVGGNQVEFDKDGISKVDVRKGNTVKVEAVPNDPVRFYAEVTVNGNPIEGKEFVVGGGKCEIEVKFVAKPEFEVAVEVKGDITYGKVTVAVDGGWLAR